MITEIGKVKKAPDLFDPIEIWSRTGDPMAVGIIGEEKPRYFSIVRWGDAKLTLAQVKKRLHVEKWLLLLTATGGIGFFAVTLGCHGLWRIEKWVRMLRSRSCGMASANERVGEQQLDGS